MYSIFENFLIASQSCWFVLDLLFNDSFITKNIIEYMKLCLDKHILLIGYISFHYKLFCKHRYPHLSTCFQVTLGVCLPLEISIVQTLKKNCLFYQEIIFSSFFSESIGQCQS